MKPDCSNCQKNDCYHLDPAITLEHTDKFFGVMHASSKCAGNYCTIHNRSNHHMRGFKQNWRSDAGFMERVCEHGIGHPDPDEIVIRPGHGCDGCCLELNPPRRFRDIGNGE